MGLRGTLPVSAKSGKKTIDMTWEWTQACLAKWIKDQLRNELFKIGDTVRLHRKYLCNLNTMWIMNRYPTVVEFISITKSRVRPKDMSTTFLLVSHFLQPAQSTWIRFSFLFYYHSHKDSPPLSTLTPTLSVHTRKEGSFKVFICNAMLHCFNASCMSVFLWQHR